MLFDIKIKESSPQESVATCIWDLKSVSLSNTLSRLDWNNSLLRDDKMASVTKKLKVRRALNKARAGKKRKNALRLHGSTAVSLPLDKPNANEKAQLAAKQA